MMRPLSQDFFAKDTLTVARELLGHHLLMWNDDAGDFIRYRIVETEAYTQEDPSCHAFRGRKGRGAHLYGPPGMSYVYLIYGMYHCLNVVTEPDGRAGAVLFRALEPLDNSAGETRKTHGPGRLCKVLGINTPEHNNLPFYTPDKPFFLSEGEAPAPEQIITTTRIGISIAQDYPWRFYIKDSPWVSVKAKR